MSMIKNLGIRRMSFVLGLFLSLMMFLTPSVSFAQNIKIGYVDLQRALNEVDEGKKAKAKLKREFKKKQKELNKLQEEVKKIKKEIEGAGPMMTNEAKRAKLENFQKKIFNLQKVYAQHQGDLAKKEAKATKKIFDKMGKVIEKIAKERGYTLVLERTESAILYAGDGMDLTAELIKRYNAAN